MLRGLTGRWVEVGATVTRMSSVLMCSSASAEFPSVLSSGSVPLIYLLSCSTALVGVSCPWNHWMISLHRLCHWCPCEGFCITLFPALFNWGGGGRLCSTLKHKLCGVAILCFAVSSRQGSLSQGSPQVLFPVYVIQMCPFQSQVPQNSSDIFRHDQINRNPCRAHNSGLRDAFSLLLPLFFPSMLYLDFNVTQP